MKILVYACSVLGVFSGVVVGHWDAVIWAIATALWAHNYFSTIGE